MPAWSSIASASLAVAVACVDTGAALAQRYPAGPVRLIAPAPPGSPVDIRARWLAHKLAPALGQPVVVDNRAGAGGSIGTELAAKSAPDGYTLVVVHQGTLALNPHIYARTGYDALADFIPVTRLVDTVLMLAVPSQSPVRSVADLIQLAKQRPGQLSYGSSGVGTPPHLAGELFKRMAGIDVVHVPYKGATPALMDLVAGRLAYTIDSLSLQMPQVNAGKLRGLAVTGKDRLPVAPDVPSMAQAGVAGYEYRSWMGIAAPARTPIERINRLNAEIVRALKSPESIAWYAAQGGEVVGDQPEEFAAFIRAEHAKWGAIIREAGIRAD